MPWLNNFTEFEKNVKRANRLVMNFYNPEKRRKVKAYVKQNVRIPTQFLTKQASEELEEKIKQGAFSSLQFSKKEFESFFVCTIEMPYLLELVKALPNEFQKGSYDKLLRFGGMFPERNAELSKELERRFSKEEEIELESLEGIVFKDFVTEEQLKEVPWLYIDIEKPLWKHEDEKAMLDERERLMKQEEKYTKLKQELEKGARYAKRLEARITKHGRDTEKGDRAYRQWKIRCKKNSDISRILEKEELIHASRQKRILELEEKLTIEVESVGKIPLYDEKYNADISFVTTIWKNDGRLTKEIFVLDPNLEIEEKSRNGYLLLKFKTEEELVKALIKRLHKRKPVVSIGHNQVYDISQLRYASDEYGLILDPAVTGVKPRRDYVKKFLQRLREDLIYFDTLWMTRILAPYLMQKSFGTSLKLESVADHFGIDFKKSMTHKQLREVELRRLVGKTPEIRSQARNAMLDYVENDVTTTKKIADIELEILLPLFTRLKKVLPFSTLSEIAFSTNCMNKSHEYRHFQRAGNLPYYGYKTKIREDEKQIFKKRFKALKDIRMKDTAKFYPIKGAHENIQQYYFSLEESLKDFAFFIEPKLKEVYDWAVHQSEKSEVGKAQLFALMQYLRVFVKEPLIDYYFARRDGTAYFHACDILFKRFISTLSAEVIKKEGGEKEIKRKFQDNLEAKFSRIKKEVYKVDKTLLNRFIGSFKFLKNHFRSIYVALEGRKRGLIRPDGRIADLATRELPLEYAESIEFPEIVAEDADLYLLRKYARTIERELKTKYQKSNLASFLRNFQKFEETSREIERIMQAAGVSASKSSTFDLLYAYLYYHRCKKDDAVFWKRYNFSVQELNQAIKKAYLDLASSVNSQGQVVDVRGDYLFVKSNNNKPISVPCLYHVRDLEKYAVGKNTEHPLLNFPT